MVWTSPTKPWHTLSPKQQTARRALWASGNLLWKLDPLQRRMHSAIRTSNKRFDNSTDRWFYLDAARRTGKDYVCPVIAAEEIMRNRRNIRIPYAAATQTSVRELLVPNILAVFEDCPPELLPDEIKNLTFRKSADRLTFPWGAQIVMVGMDLHPDRLRGSACYMAVFTEAGFMKDFGNTLKSVMVPQFQTEPDGFWIIGTTPPATPAHEIDTEWYPEAKRTGRLFHATIDDNPRITEAQKAAQIRMLGGPKSTMTRRELYCEHVTEESLMIIPEWQKVRDVCVREFERPPWVNCYVALDPGIVHFCASQGGYYDFERDTLFIEWDFAAPGLNTWEVAVRLWAREWQLWGWEPRKPKRMGDAEWATALEEVRTHFYPGLAVSKPLQRWTGHKLDKQPALRVSDTDMRLIADLSNEHGLTFAPTAKDDRDAAINGLRLRVQNCKVVVHPRCTHTVSHLDHGIWNKKRTDFAESGNHGHFDALASLIYLDRNVQMQRGRNPFPPAEMFLDTSTHHIPVQSGVAAHRAPATKVLEQVFGGRRNAHSGGKAQRLYKR